MTEHNFSRNEVIDLLQKNVCVVNFTKRDGSSREMKCTLLGEYLPQQLDVEEYGQAKSTKNNANNVVAFDIDTQGWRTFNINRLNSIALVLSV